MFFFFWVTDDDALENGQQQTFASVLRRCGEQTCGRVAVVGERCEAMRRVRYQLLAHQLRQTLCRRVCRSDPIENRIEIWIDTRRE